MVSVHGLSTLLTSQHRGSELSQLEVEEIQRLGEKASEQVLEAMLDL